MGKGKVESFHLGTEGHIRHLILSDGHCVDDNVCDVRHITLQDLYSRKQIWNPILLWIELSSMIPLPNRQDDIKGNESCFDTSVLYPDAPVAINSLGQSRSLQQERRKWQREMEKHKLWLNCKRHPTKTQFIPNMTKEAALNEIDELKEMYSKNLKHGCPCEMQPILQCKTVNEYYN